MEIKVREMCAACSGTGRNKLSDTAAMKKLDEMPLGGILQHGEFAPPPMEVRLRALQECNFCTDGYIESWVDLKGLVGLI